MLNSTKFIERILQNYRFRIAKPYLIGDVLDFGGNKGELKKFVKGRYLAVNYDYSVMKNTHFDTIVSLATIEHIKEIFNVFQKFKAILNIKGKIVLTTPTKMAKPVLNFLAFIRLLDRENIREHKHYWSKKEIYDLAEKSGFVVEKYAKFQLGFNQLVVLKHFKK